MKYRWTLSLLLILCGSMAFVSCETPPSKGARAYEIKTRGSLIGGAMALAHIGDYMLENSKIRVAVSRHGISRAYGLFGGNIVDADRVRSATGNATSAGGKGYDSLIETFPLFFLSTVDSTGSKVIQSGEDGKAAIVRVEGKGASFIALTEQINNMVSFEGNRNRLGFTMDYILEPGKNYVKIKITIKNTNSSYNFQTFGAIPAVSGMVGLFGKRNSLFIPGTASYNIRFNLEKAFETKLNAPAIPGIVGDFIGSKGRNGVNYGFVAEASKDNYVFSNKKEYAKLGFPKGFLNQGSLVVPLEGSSITAAFTKNINLKTLRKKGGTSSYSIYFVVGDGSVSSIRNAQLDIHKRVKGLATGRVLSERTHRPLNGVQVLAYRYMDDKKKGLEPGKRIFYSDFTTNSDGYFQGSLEPGKYYLIARENRGRSKEILIEVQKDKSVFQQLELPEETIISYTVRDQRGQLMPAKVTVLGKVGDFDKGKCVGKASHYCMFDPHLGESEAVTDFRAGNTCSDGKRCGGNGDCKSSTGKDKRCFYRLQAATEYREAFSVCHNGTGKISVRSLPAGKKYKLVVSRGMEYELAVKEVEAKPGQIVEVEFVLQQTIHTPKMISADLHVHTNLSHDSAITDYNRIASFAAEGVDFFTTTDHNRIRDMQPIVEALKLERWLKTAIGLEITTFEMGHFNAFPLKLDLLSFSGGTPAWFKKDSRYQKDSIVGGPTKPIKGLRKGLSPGEIFASMRKLGSLCKDDPKCEKTIIQVNHPRDSIFGYFNTYNLSADRSVARPLNGITSPLSREFEKEKFTHKFDAIEIFNGKRLDLIWHWRMPPKSKLTPQMLRYLVGYKVRPDIILRIEDSDNKGKAKVAYVGGGDDWFNLLNRGFKYTGTANSDSHSFSVEAGNPRNYFLTGFSDPQKMTDQILSKMVLDRKLLMTNGPIIEFSAIDADGSEKSIGETVNAKTEGGKKTVTFKIKVRAASWIDTTELLFFKNGRVVKRVPILKGTQPIRLEQSFSFDVSDGDAWFVVTVKGVKDLWPVFRPDEVEPFQIGTAVSLVKDTLLGNLPISFPAAEEVCIQPTQAQRVRPYAITNPIWVDIDKKGFKADPCRTLGEKGVRCNASGTTCKGGFCLNSQSCKKSTDCGKGASCIGGKCSEEPCSGLKCSPSFTACSAKKACADDTCSDNNKTCIDGTSCKADSDCSGKKGGGLCRYCRCPSPRKACKDGKTCSKDSDCEKGECAMKRFCAPTACSLGYCVPTYPVCAAKDVHKSTHRFLMTKKKAARLKDKHKDHIERAFPFKDKFEIRKTRNFFLFFEHKH